MTELFPDPVTIRPINADDLESCARIMADNPLWQKFGVTFQSALKRFQAGYENHAQIAISAGNKKVTGFIWFAEQGAFLRSGYISLLGIDPNSQGHGTGKALLIYAEDQLYQVSSDIFLLCSDFNLRAQAFYRRMGYQQVGTIPNYILPGCAELIFHKKRADRVEE